VCVLCVRLFVVFVGLGGLSFCDVFVRCVCLSVFCCFLCVCVCGKW